MAFTLINGQYDSADAYQIIEELISVKIKYHERMIKKSSSEEDIKMRENRIKSLQNGLIELRSRLSNGDSKVNLKATIDL